MSEAIARARAAAAALRGARSRPPAPGADRFFFVVGRAKSGTTWLERTLDAHPEILCRGEGRFFGREQPLGAARGRSLLGILGRSEELREWTGRSVWTRGGGGEERLTEIAGAAARELMGAELARSGKRLAGDKTPLMAPTVVGEIAAACPGARIVHIVRDGRDVAVSSAHHVWNLLDDQPERQRDRADQLAIRDSYRADPDAFKAGGRSIFAPGELERTARDWADVTLAAREQGSSLGEKLYAEVRYEDLLARGSEELARILEFLGADASDDVIERCLRSTDFERLSGGRASGEEDSTAFLRSGTAGGWREVFTPDDREAFKRGAGGALRQLGYERDGGW